MELSRPLVRPKTKLSLWNPAALFLIFGTLIGVLFCIAIPYGAGFDEETHQVRIMDIAFLHMLPNRSKNQTITWREFYKLSYQRRFFDSPADDLFAPDNFQLKLDNQNILRATTRSIYSPVIFFPQAAVALVGFRALHLPVIPVTIAERIACMLVYLAAAYVTIRMLPFGKWLFLILALAPTALYQAATLNADGFTNAACFLFTGLALKLHADRENEFKPWQIWTLAGLCLMVGLAKPGYFVVLPLALILPRGRFPSRKLYALLWAAIVLAVAVNLGWLAVSATHSQFSEPGSQSLADKLGVILADPLNFISVYFRGIAASIDAFYQDWVAVYGHWVGEVPAPVYTLFPLALLFALLAEPRAPNFSGKARLFLVGLFLFTTGAIIFLYFYLHYSPDQDVISGRQGRYYIPTAPFLLLALAGLVSPWAYAQKAARILSVGLLLGALGYYSLGLYATYYTECGYAQFAGQSCVLPRYKNLDVSEGAPVFKVSDQKPLSQAFVSHCEPVKSVGMYIKTVPSDKSGSLRLTLLDGSQKVLAARDFPVRRILARHFLTLPVAQPAGTEGSAYELRIEMTGSSEVGVLLREGHYYKEGSASSAGKPVGVDSVFQYTCAENP